MNLRLRSAWSANTTHKRSIICFFLGQINVPLSRKGVGLGNQRLHMASPDVAFRLTSMTGAVEHYEKQLRSLLSHTPLRALQWINLAHHRMEFVTLVK
jgi:hypothetical protein